jgi:predicted lipoprotein with Yx(FWY)xxD motif
MTRFQNMSRPHRPRAGALLLVAIAGFLVAGLVGVAVARTFTLNVAKHATVQNGNTGNRTTENIVVTSRGFAVYDLSGETVRHPECTKGNGCFGFWPPVTVSSLKSLSKAPGITGKLGIWRRDGLRQVTLAGHPLYRYFADTRHHRATGEALNTFGGIWHVIKPMSTKPVRSTTTTTTSSSTTSSSMTSSSSSCLYPPC